MKKFEISCNLSFDAMEVRLHLELSQDLMFFNLKFVL